MHILFHSWFYLFFLISMFLYWCKLPYFNFRLVESYCYSSHLFIHVWLELYEYMEIKWLLEFALHYLTVICFLVFSAYCKTTCMYTMPIFFFRLNQEYRTDKIKFYYTYLMSVLSAMYSLLKFEFIIAGLYKFIKLF